MDEAVVRRAAEVLRAGGLVALPTETVYGLAADASQPTAVRRVFEVKGRPADHPLIVHIADVDQLATWAARVPPAARRLGEAFWPGPLTVVLPRAAWVSDVVTGGLDTIALRVPSHPLTLAILRAFGGGVAAPSANRFGQVSPTTAAHVRADLGDEVELVVDGGASAVGIESTIVDLSADAPWVLRLGGLTLAAIEEVLGVRVGVRLDASGGELGLTRAPGQLRSHYAPRTPLEVVAPDELTGRVAALRAQGLAVCVVGPTPGADVRVPRTDTGLAQALYSALREADAAGADRILVTRPPDGPLAAALRDRLRRAAAPKDA